MGRPRIEMVGKKYGKLTVVEQYQKQNGHKKPVYYCKCDCDCGTKNYEVQAGHLRNGHTKSCGCINWELHKKYNNYDLTGEYGIGWTSNTNKKFYFDLEDYEKIKEHCWREDACGYVVSSSETGTVYLHRLIMGNPSEKYVDHKRHNLLDNRKSELRVLSSSENHMNAKMQRNNKSGFTGVYFDNSRCLWVAKITINYEDIFLGQFSDLQKAIDARKQGEEIYFGDKSFKNSVGYYNNELEEVIS